MERDDLEGLEVIFQRFGFLGLGILLLFLPYVIYDNVGYSGPLYIGMEFFITLVGFILVVFSTLSWKNKEISKRKLRFITFLLLSAISTLIIIIGLSQRAIYTDELAIEMLSAKRIMSGLNPYGYNFGAAALLSYGVPLSSLTPTITGGYISSLQYPDLMVILLIPFYYFHIDPDILLFVMTIVLLWIIANEFIVRKMIFMVPLAIAVSLFNINLIFFSYDGITDIVWVVFLSLSLVTLQKRYQPGIFFGLSVAAKQLPIFILPFLLIFIYKRYGVKRAIEFMFFALLIFFALNAPFIIANAGLFFRAVLAPESSPLLGIGFGLSQIYFSGYVPFADSEFFTILMVCVWLFFIIIYLEKFETLKYSLTVLPIIVVIFNYRLLENYIMYWPIITMTTIPYIISKNKENYSPSDNVVLKSKVSNFLNKVKLNEKMTRKIYNVALLIIIIFIVSVPVFVLVENDYSHRNEIKIVSATISATIPGGYADSLTLNMTYGAGISNTSMNFRILEDGFLNNPNGFFWKEKQLANNKILDFAVYSLYTNNTSEYLLANNSYIIIAYNQYTETWYHITVGKNLIF